MTHSICRFRIGGRVIRLLRPGRGDPRRYVLEWASLCPDDVEPQGPNVQTYRQHRVLLNEYEHWWLRNRVGQQAFQQVSRALRRAQELGADIPIWPLIDAASESRLGPPGRIDEDGRPWWNTEDCYVSAYLDRDGYLEYRRYQDAEAIFDTLVEYADMKALHWWRQRRHLIPVQGIGGRWVFGPAREPTFEEWITYVQATTGVDLRDDGHVSWWFFGHEDDDPILELPS